MSRLGSSRLGQSPERWCPLGLSRRRFLRRRLPSRRLLLRSRRRSRRRGRRLLLLLVLLQHTLLLFCPRRTVLQKFKEMTGKGGERGGRMRDFLNQT